MLVLCRGFALLMLLGAAFAIFESDTHWFHQTRLNIVTTDGVHRIVKVGTKDRSRPVGEVLDLSRTSTAQRYRLVVPASEGWTVPVLRAGEHRSTFVPSFPQSERPLTAEYYASEVSTIVTVLIGAFVLWRRPSAATLFFAIYCSQTIPTLPTIELFIAAPDWLLGTFAPCWFVLTNDIGVFALTMFALRFPSKSESNAGIAVSRIATAAFGAVALFYFARRALVFPLDFTDLFFDVAPAIVGLVVLLATVATRYARASGEDRRRLGWVLAGVIVGGIVSTVSFTDANASFGRFTFPAWVTFADYIFSAALPLILAYAILRHRVIDIGFAVNRGVIYATITLALVIVVSLVDWVSGRFIAEGRFSIALEALATVGFGVAMNAIHARVERTVDRLFFRERHRAERLLEERLKALDFASQSSTVDAALVTEASAILRLVSAAVYRRAPDGTFVCAAAIGWPHAPESFAGDDLLVRTLRANESTISLRQSAIADTRFPLGPERPDIAIPLSIRHELRGFALYGHRTNDTPLDSEERRQIETLVRHAAVAYDAIEADAYRREALDLRALVRGSEARALSI